MNEGMIFYRCTLCNSVVSLWDIHNKTACPKCGQVRMQQTNLSLWEKMVQIIKHPKVWEWKDVL